MTHLSDHGSEIDEAYPDETLFCEPPAGAANDQEIRLRKVRYRFFARSTRSHAAAPKTGHQEICVASFVWLVDRRHSRASRCGSAPKSVLGNEHALAAFLRGKGELHAKES